MSGGTRIVWRVMREDDQGRRAELLRVTSRAAAEAVALEFESRGCRQLYWVEAIATAAG